VASEVLDRNARMAGLDDHDDGARVDVLRDRAGDALRQIFLQHQPMGQHIDEPCDPREARDAILREECDVHLTLAGQEMMRAHEQDRDPRRQDRTACGYRKTPTQGGLRRFAIAREQHLVERARRGCGGRRELFARHVDAERFEQIPDRPLSTLDAARVLLGSCRQR
jgi:hypothetical protein